MIKVDLGAGLLNQNKIDRYKRYLGEGYDPSQYIGVDCRDVKGVDKSCDFESEKLPFEDNSVEEIITVHTLEHVRNLEHIIKECHRILKPQGLLKIWVPHCHSTIAFAEMGHVRFFATSTLDTFDVEGKEPDYPFYGYLFEKIQVKLQICRNQFKIRWQDKILENFINKKQRRREGFLKGLPYKDWEIFFKLKKSV